MTRTARAFWIIANCYIFPTAGLFVGLLILSIVLTIGEAVGKIPAEMSWNIAIQANWVLLLGGFILSILAALSRKRSDNEITLVPFLLLGCCAILLPSTEILLTSTKILVIFFGCLPIAIATAIVNKRRGWW